MQTNNQVPVTVLTGFLGAGKTTLLNRILTEQHGQKYAVIVNEFGEEGIDNDLVVDADNYLPIYSRWLRLILRLSELRFPSGPDAQKQ